MFAQARSRQNPRSGPETNALDTWLRQALGQRFDETLTENLPQELSALASRFGS